MTSLPPAAIRTTRLILLPLTVEMARAVLRGHDDLAALLEMHVPDAWPGQDYEEILPLVAAKLEHDPHHAPWDRVIVSSADQTLVGGIGCIAQPDAAGRVEIGYNIIPAYRRRGLASEAARAMVAWLWAQPAVQRITADCLPDNVASIRVLEGLGMHPLPPGDDRAVLKWDLARPIAEGDR